MLVASVLLASTSTACDTVSADYPQAREPAFLVLESWKQPAYSDDQHIIVSKDITEATEKSSWTYPIVGTMSVTDYVAEVEYQSARLDEKIVALEALEADSKQALQLPENASEEQIQQAKEQLIEAIWQHQDIWMSCYFGLAGQSKLSPPKWGREGLPDWQQLPASSLDPRSMVTVDGYGDLMLSYGSKVLPIYWSVWSYGDPVKDFAVQQAAHALAWSFASAEPGAVTHAQQATQQCVMEADALSTLRDKLSASLDQFARNHYKVLLLNGSSQPIVVVGRSELEHGGERIALEILDGREFSMFGTAEHEDEPLVVVDGGAAKVVVFAATEGFEDSQDGAGEDKLHVRYLYYEDGNTVSTSRIVDVTSASLAPATE